MTNKLSRQSTLLAVLLLLGFKGLTQTSDFESIVHGEKTAWIKAQHAQDRGGMANANNRSDIRYCRLHWTVDPAVKYIKGEVMTVFEPTESVSSLDFDFSTALTMDSIRYHGQKIAFNHSGDLLSVLFPSTLPPFLEDSITFFYKGEPTSTGFGSFEVNMHDNTPVMWTLSEPYGAMEWWPCKQALNDKIDSVDIFITNPLGYRAASNGLLLSETSVNGQTTAHWKHRYPIAAYLICMAVTNYVEYENLVPYNGETTKIVNYVYPESIAAAQNGTFEVVAQMQLYNELFGLYPFHKEKYGHAQFGWGGGMEHQTMTFVGGWGFELLGHELAHHWFGDKVTCGSWEDIWLNEGFATYLSGLCYEHLQPVWWPNFKQTRINSATSQPDGSVRVNDTTSVDRIFSGRLSYAKGAMVLHMLRWVCGDDAFFAGVRNYLNDPALAYGYAHTADLKHHLELVSGKNLDGFFADWYYGEGYPSYKIDWSVDQAHVVTIKMGQTQSHPSVSFYEMPVQLTLSNGVLDTTVVFNHTFDGQVFTIPLDFSPTALLFDPNLWIISRDNFVQELTSTGEPKPQYYMEIIPNPSPKNITVHLTVPTGGIVKLNLFQADGKLVESRNVTAHQGLNILTLDGPARVSGWYYLRLEGKDWQAEKGVLVK